MLVKNTYSRYLEYCQWAHFAKQICFVFRSNLWPLTLISILNDFYGFYCILKTIIQHLRNQKSEFESLIKAVCDTRELDKNIARYTLISLKQCYAHNQSLKKKPMIKNPPIGENPGEETCWRSSWFSNMLAV